MVNFFSIGMTKSEVMSKLDSTQATDKTKQFINNFWNTDIDGKVTNEIELTMLNSWANGSEKIKMPTKGKGIQPLSKSVFDDGSKVEYWESVSNKRPIPTDIEMSTYDRLTIMEGNSKYGNMHSVMWCDGNIRDELIDVDNDGYADKRKYYDEFLNVTPSHKDNNMDGNLFDKKKKNTLRGNGLRY